MLLWLSNTLFLPKSIKEINNKKYEGQKNIQVHCFLMRFGHKFTQNILHTFYPSWVASMIKSKRIAKAKKMISSVPQALRKVSIKKRWWDLPCGIGRAMQNTRLTIFQLCFKSLQSSFIHVLVFFCANKVRILFL